MLVIPLGYVRGILKLQSARRGDVLKVSAVSHVYGYTTEAAVGVQVGTEKADYFFPKSRRAHYSETHFGEDVDVTHRRLPNEDVEVRSEVSGNYSMYYTGERRAGQVTREVIPAAFYAACVAVKSMKADQFLLVG